MDRECSCVLGLFPASDVVAFNKLRTAVWFPRRLVVTVKTGSNSFFWRYGTFWPEGRVEDLK